MNQFPIRTSAKAVIIHKGALLTTRNKCGDQEFNLLPGGGQNHKEDLESTLKRECWEEAGARIDVGDILFVRDYIADNHDFAPTQSGFHQLELMFRCHILNPDDPLVPQEKDDYQLGLQWIPLKELPGSSFFPKSLQKELSLIEDKADHKIYLGDIN